MTNANTTPLTVEGFRAIAAGTKDSLAREVILTLIDALTQAVHASKRNKSKYEAMKLDRDYWRTKANQEHQS